MINTIIKASVKIGKPIAECSKVALKDAKNCRFIGRDINAGVKHGARLARMQNQSTFSRIGTQSISVARQTNKHLPGIMAAISLPTFVPSALSYLAGKILQKCLAKIL